MYLITYLILQESSPQGRIFVNQLLQRLWVCAVESVLCIVFRNRDISIHRCMEYFDTPQESNFRNKAHLEFELKVYWALRAWQKAVWLYCSGSLNGSLPNLEGFDKPWVNLTELMGIKSRMIWKWHFVVLGAISNGNLKRIAIYSIQIGQKLTDLQENQCLMDVLWMNIR